MFRFPVLHLLAKKCSREYTRLRHRERNTGFYFSMPKVRAGYEARRSGGHGDMKCALTSLHTGTFVFFFHKKEPPRRTRSNPSLWSQQHTALATQPPRRVFPRRSAKSATFVNQSKTIVAKLGAKHSLKMLPGPSTLHHMSTTPIKACCLISIVRNKKKER